MIIQLKPASRFEATADKILNNAVDDFIDGQDDCKKGEEHKPGRSKAYDDGYSYQYEIEQIAGELWK